MNLGNSAQQALVSASSTPAPLATSLRARLQQPSQMARYREWLAAERGLRFERYEDLWAWSVADLDGFWRSIWDYFAMGAPVAPGRALVSAAMPGATWFADVHLNYAEQVFRHTAPAHAAGMPALVCRDERDRHLDVSWPVLQAKVGALAQFLMAQGVGVGDRVVAYLPNAPETVIGFLACASIGAIWSVCAPDMGTVAVIDRFQQIAPKVLLGCDGVVYGHRELDRLDTLVALVQGLRTIEQVVLCTLIGVEERVDHWRHELDDALSDSGRSVGVHHWDVVVAPGAGGAPAAAFQPIPVPFDHPLWVVYSSGTTGLPKPITHSHGGIVLVHRMQLNLHLDLGCSYDPATWAERFHWYSSTGWIMWNLQVGGLLHGTTICLYDGSPSGAKESPDWGVLWQFAAETRVTFFGAGSAFYGHCNKAGVVLADYGDFEHVHALGATGSPLALEAQQWGEQQFADLGLPAVWWSVISGGTDFGAAFVGGLRDLPARMGAMQCRILGCAVYAWRDREAGEIGLDIATSGGSAGPSIDALSMRLVGEVGELVCEAPIPSMPLYFWGDVTGERLRETYFEVYPGYWRHGDWLEVLPDGACIIYGRSDTTINRNGLRLGSSEIYRAVEAVPEVDEALIVDLEFLGRESWMPLFVALRPGARLDRALQERIRDAIRQALSPRFLPDEIVQVGAIPKTLSGKKMELPVKKMLLGGKLAQVLNVDAMANPESLEAFQAYAQRYLGLV